MTDFILHNPEIVSPILFLLFAIPISIFDVKNKKIPDLLNYMSTIVLLCYRAVTLKKECLIYVLSAALAVLLMLIVRFATRKGIGLGDIKFSACCGAYAGPVAVFVGFVIAAIISFICISILTHKGKHKKGEAFAFAPFLAGGTLLSSAPVILLYFLNLAGL